MSFTPTFESKIRIMKNERGYFSVEQANKIIASTGSTRNKLLLMTLATTGRRVSEAIQIKPDDIDYVNELINWQIGKKKIPERRWIRANRGLLLALKTYEKKLDLEPQEYFFNSTHNRGEPISRQRVFQIVRYAGKKARITKLGGEGIHPHHFRHSFCVWGARRIKNAGDLKLLQMLMAHAKIETTAYYLQFAQAEAEELINKMPNFLGGQEDADNKKKVIESIVKGSDDFLQLGLSDEEIKKKLKEKPSKEDDYDITRISDGVTTEL